MKKPSKKQIETLIQHEVRANRKITQKAMLLYIENRISRKRFNELVDEALS